ncbi:MAG: phosphatase PAP2 family protein [Elusimicrobia bacterium]|nr:phosphatase PAP2 family protein [Elusimicrobiota bacterium]
MMAKAPRSLAAAWIIVASLSAASWAGMADALLGRYFGERAPAVEAGSAPESYYLDEKNLPSLGWFPPPPQRGSAADQEDFKALHAWQDDRTAMQCAAAAYEENPTYGNFFGDISPLPEPLPPHAAVFFLRVSADAGLADWLLKKRFQRPRPFLVDSTLWPCIGKPKGYAYPSGHATLSRLFGLILSDLAPRRKAEFLARADEAALNRVIGGVHHPSDIEAGKLLGDELLKLLKKSHDFNVDLDALRRDVVQP